MPGRLDDLRFDLASIYRHHHRLVRWVVRGAGVPEHAVDDVTQDVFVAIHRRRTQAPDSGMRRWVIGVARSVCHSYRRGSARRLHRLARTPEPEPSPLPDDLLDGRTALRRLRSALDALAEPQREVFVLMELEGLSAPEAAEALGANLSTVYSRLRLARQRVWAELAPTPGGPAAPPGDALDRAAKEVLASAREAGRPPREQVRHGWALIAARIRLERVPVGQAAAATSAAAGKIGGLAIGACLGAAMLGGLLVARNAASARDPREVTAAATGSRAAASAPRAGPDEVEPTAASVPAAVVSAVDRTMRPREAEPPRPGPRPARKAPASTLADETELLRRAAKSLDSGELDETTRLLDVHARRFADGVLADERRRLHAELERLRTTGTPPRAEPSTIEPGDGS